MNQIDKIEDLTQTLFRNHKTLPITETAEERHARNEGFLEQLREAAGEKIRVPKQTAEETAKEALACIIAAQMLDNNIDLDAVRYYQEIPNPRR